MSSIGVRPSWTDDPRGRRAADTALAAHLAVAPERWGWEFVEPAPPAPFAERAPVWCPPSPPNLGGLFEARESARIRMWKFVAAALSVFCVGAVVAKEGAGDGALVVASVMVLGLVAIGVLGHASARSAVTTAERAYAQRAQGARHAYDEHETAHRRRKRTWEAGERHRIDSALLHYPLMLSRASSRVDVFGGAGRSWECLLATMGSTALADGTSILCLDFSEQDVAGSLVDFATVVAAPVARARAPEVFAGAGFLDSLHALELAEVLAEAIAASRPRDEADATRPLDVDLLHAVTRRLEGPVDLARIVAGLDVLRSAHDDAGPLSATEIGRLAATVDVVAAGDRAREELRLLSRELSLLAAPGGAHSCCFDELWNPRGLTVISTDDVSSRATRLSRRLLVQLAIEHLGRGPLGAGTQMLVVAGADEVGRDTLETLTRRTTRAGMRLVLLFAHLREDARDLVGGADGATLFMRLGNFQEAEAAATFVGRHHQFQLTQISESRGTNHSRSESTNRTNGTTVTQTEGSNSGRSGLHFQSGQSFSVSTADSVSESVGTTFTSGTSQTDGTVVQRSYEFHMEPTEFQELPDGCFVLVDVGRGGRRIAIGNCHPALVLAPRMSAQPRVQR